MGRWSKRTEEEKIRIAQASKVEKGTPYERRQRRRSEEETKFVLACYEKGIIPIPCPKCLTWRASEKYEAVTEKMGVIFGDKETYFVAGKCTKCGSRMKTAFPDPLSHEGMVFMMAFASMLSKGIMVDKRKKIDKIIVRPGGGSK